MHHSSPPTWQSELFDTSHYADTLGRKLLRSFQLAGRYYLADVPRYFQQRRRLGLRGRDLAVLGNPLREFHRRTYVELPPPAQLDEAVAACYEAGVRFTMPPVRLFALAAVWWSCRGVAGDVIECGAYRGATSLLLAVLGRLNNVGQKVFLLDTFRGMPAPSRFDSQRSTGEFTPPAEIVSALHAQAKSLRVDDRVEVCPGLFAETFQNWNGRPMTFALAHIDANIYQGTLEACQYCLPRMAAGGTIVFDDYNGLCDLGARLAIDQVIGPSQLTMHPLAHCSAYVRIPTGTGK